MFRHGENNDEVVHLSRPAGWFWFIESESNNPSKKPTNTIIRVTSHLQCRLHLITPSAHAELKMGFHGCGETHASPPGLDYISSKLLLLC